MPGVVLSLVIVIQDLLALLERKRNSGSWKTLLDTAAKDAWLAESLPFFGYLLCMIGLTLLVGQKIALPIFIGVYLVRWGNYSKWTAISYALGCWAIMVFFYDQVMSLLFHPSLLELNLQSSFPAGFPDWLIF